MIVTLGGADRDDPGNHPGLRPGAAGDRRDLRDRGVLPGTGEHRVRTARSLSPGDDPLGHALVLHCGPDVGPGAIVGALLAKWLATGKGIGDLWASVVGVTLASLLIYSLINVLEGFVLARFGPAPGR
jgi:hypothetical protein